VVARSHPQPGVDLSYVKLSGESVGDAGDQYTGLDRLGRIVDQRWRSGSTDQDRFTNSFYRKPAGHSNSIMRRTHGPYAENLNKVLQVIEGHFTRGYGDSPKKDNDIELLPGAVELADAVLHNATQSCQRLEVVADWIDGFETPYGMKLLSSVHWVAYKSETHATNAEEAIEAVHAWNDRKRQMLKPEHIRVAWRRLQEFTAARSDDRTNGCPT